MKPKPQVMDLKQQQTALDRVMYSYAEEDRRNRQAYLTKIQKLCKDKDKEKQKIKWGFGPVRKGLTRKDERKLLKEKEIKTKQKK